MQTDESDWYHAVDSQASLIWMSYHRKDPPRCTYLNPFATKPMLNKPLQLKRTPENSLHAGLIMTANQNRTRVLTSFSIDNMRPSPHRPKPPTPKIDTAQHKSRTYHNINLSSQTPNQICIFEATLMSFLSTRSPTLPLDPTTPILPLTRHPHRHPPSSQANMPVAHRAIRNASQTNKKSSSHAFSLLQHFQPSH